MQNISKPRIVDFLRTCDKNNWVFPRIRFASVRSKPELIEDIEQNFFVSVLGNFISIIPRQKYRRVPEIHYCLSERKFLLDGEYRELRKESREKPKFQILSSRISVDFFDPEIVSLEVSGLLLQALLFKRIYGIIFSYIDLLFVLE